MKKNVWAVEVGHRVVEGGLSRVRAFALAKELLREGVAGVAVGEFPVAEGASAKRRFRMTPRGWASTG